MPMAMLRCLEHGWVQGPVCVACEAIRVQNLVKKNLLDLPVLTEGHGPLPTDPSPALIKFRAIHERRERELVEEKWKHTLRIVRVYSFR